MKIYTIKDIAKLADVSKGTVDRVLHKRGKVSEKALQKVNKVLKEIDYKPNPIARNLKNNKVYKISVVLPDPKEDAFWMPCVEAVEEAMQEFKTFGIAIQHFFYSPSSTDSFFKISEEVLKALPDAVILTPLFYKESVEVANNFRSKGIIVSTFNNEIESNQIGSFVGQNLFKSGRVAANLMHMVTLPKSKIVILHMDEVFNNAQHMQQKEKGFRNYFEELIDYNYDIVTLNIIQSELNKSFTAFLQLNTDVSGIFITTSKAYKIVEILEKSNFKNVNIIGYDLLPKNIGYMKMKKINFLIHQNPKKQTYLSINYIVEHFLFRKDIPKQKLLPIDIVNSENLSSHIES